MRFIWFGTCIVHHHVLTLDTVFQSGVDSWHSVSIQDFCYHLDPITMDHRLDCRESGCNSDSF